MGAVFISSLACGILVHPSTAQPRGSKIASSDGRDGPRSSLLQGLVDSLYNPFIKGSEAPHLG